MSSAASSTSAHTESLPPKLLWKKLHLMRAAETSTEQPRPTPPVKLPQTEDNSQRRRVTVKRTLQSTSTTTLVKLQPTSNKESSKVLANINIHSSTRSLKRSPGLKRKFTELTNAPITSDRIKIRKLSATQVTTNGSKSVVYVF